MPDTGDNMDGKEGVKSLGDISCLRDLSGSGDELLHLKGLLAVAAGRAEELCSTRVPSHPADETTSHTDNCCLHTEAPGSAGSLADVQVCKNTGLDCSLSRNSLLSEQADAPRGKGDSASSAAVLDVHPEIHPGVSDDFSDDDLEYFECSDVLTAREDEIWKRKLQFLLESDDEDDLKLSEDCDGCARFLGEAPRASPVSGDTAPVETPIGFWGHHSKFTGLSVSRDPCMSSQSPLQADMTLAVGHRREGSATSKDSVPVPSAAAGNEQPSGQGGADAGGHLAGKARHPDPAPAGADPSAGGTGAAGTMTGAGTERGALGEGSLLLEEGGRTVPEENTQHPVCAFTETLRRNLFKLLNPLELCRYVSTIGQSLQAAAEGRESTAREGVLIPKETESLEVQAEEADKDWQWERRRTRGLPEQNQLPDEDVSLGDRGADLKSVTQNCENLCVEPKTEGTFMACERGGSSQAAAGTLSADNRLQAENAELQTSLWGERESCHQAAFSGQEIISNANESKAEVSGFPSGGAPGNQECLCAVLPPAKLCEEPGEGQQSSGCARRDSSDADLPCSPSGGADPQPVLEWGGRGGADVSAVHDRLWQLLHEDDSDCQIPFTDRGITSLEMGPVDVQVPQQGTCCHPPLLMDVVEEQEPLPAPSPGQAECSDHLPQGAAAPTACVAQEGLCGDCAAGNETEAPAVCTSAISIFLRPGQCSRPGPGVMDSRGSTEAWEGKPPVNKAAQPWEADSARSGDLAGPEAKPADGTAGQSLHPEHSISWVNRSVPGGGCHLRDCHPARGGLACCPEEKGIFPSDNTCQLAHAGHPSVNTRHGSDELNLQAEGNHSQSDTNSQSCHLSNITSCQDFQVVSAAQKYGSVMPVLIETPEAMTPKNLPQNAEQLPETAKQEGAFSPSSRDLLLSHLSLEVPSCEPAKPGGDQRDIHTADEQRAPREQDQGMKEQSDSQQLPGTAALLLLTPAGRSEGLLPSSSAVTCQVTTGNRNLSVLETSCRASQGLSQRAPGESKGEGDERERPRVTEGSPDEAGTKAALHTSVSCQAQRQVVNTSTERSCPDGIPSTQADYSIQSTEHDKGEEVRAAESVVSGLVHLPVVDPGSNGCFQEQTPCSRTRPFSPASATCNSINTDRQRAQEGSKSCQAEPEPPRGKQDTAKGGHSAAGAKKKLPPAALSKKPRLEEKGGVSCLKKAGKSEAGVARKEERKPEQRKLVLKKDSKAPRLLKKIQAEAFPEGSGNVKLCCQFGDIHGDSTVTWTKDSKVLARLQRSAQDDSPVSLEIAKAAHKDQGMYYCCLNNTYGKVTAEFHLTAAVLERLSSFQSYEGVEEIEFMQLLFREDSLSDSYFGGPLRGALATEELHFGEGMHRRAFRSRVRRGLAPVFAPGRACVLKVHSALSPASGTRDELVRRNYDLALQECCVQNAAREYAKLYAAEAETLEGFGEVPEIIPIFLIHRPANTIPYATVEEELVGEFVKYSVRDGKEVNFLRRDSEAGQKCCTFQHWVYEKTSGNLLVTDLQGVGMRLTDVGIATLAKGYKGFKGNCSFSFIEQFRALHQCNEYCEMLGLKSLRAPPQKQRRGTAPKGKTLPSSSSGKKTGPKKGREH